MIIIILAWFFTMIIGSTLNILSEATADLHRFDKDFFSFPKTKNIDN